MQGEHAEIITEDARYSGTLVSEDNDKIVLKLASGYNIGISRKRAKEIKRTGKTSEKKTSSKKTQVDSKLPVISLLHTGGTIASRVDYATGAVSARFTPDDILEMFPDLSSVANVRSRLISNMMSENMRFHHYNLMARAVEEERKAGAKGVIITHGTDTLHYSAAALSFALEHIDIPVVFIGSQRSSDRPSTDSASNLMAASVFISNSEKKGVFVCMHENMNDEACIVIEGVNARKMHSSRRDAFRPINKGLVARVDVEKKKVDILDKRKTSNGNFSLKLFDEKLKVGMIKVRPQMFAEEFKPYESFDGLVLEGTGLGHAQIVAFDAQSKENEKICEELTKLCKKIPVAMTLQTIYGRVDMNVYSEGRKLMDMGVIGNYADMNPETGFIKLAWLLSNHKSDARLLFAHNLRGEISERSDQSYFLR